MHKQDVILFIVGLVVPTRLIIVRLCLLLATWTGQTILKDYIEHHFLHRKHYE